MHQQELAHTNKRSYTKSNSRLRNQIQDVKWLRTWEEFHQVDKATAHREVLKPYQLDTEYHMFSQVDRVL